MARTMRSPAVPEVPSSKLGGLFMVLLIVGLVSFALGMLSAVLSGFVGPMLSGGLMTAAQLLFWLGGASLLALLFLFIYTRVRMHLLELMILLALCSVPWGVMLRGAMDRNDLAKPSTQTNILVAGVGSSLFLLLGAAWGLHAAARVDETRTWHRIMFMIAGWSGIFGGLCFVFALLTSAGLSRMDAETDYGLILFCWIFSSSALPALVFEFYLASRPKKKINREETLKAPPDA